MRQKRGRCAAAALIVFACATVPVHAAPEVALEAEKILRRMADHIGALKSFSVETDVSTEVILQNGQKIEVDGAGSGVFDRERGFRFVRRGIGAKLDLVFDGEKLTLFAEDLNGYQTLAVDGDNDAALDEVRSTFGIEAAGGADLLYADPYEGLTYDVESAIYVGEVEIAGKRAHHLAYRLANVDWQLWVQAEGEPLPLKYVITSKWVTGSPEFTLEIRWNTSPTIDDAAFKFTAPEGAQEIDATGFEALDIFKAE